MLVAPVTVVIPAYEAAHHLSGTLQSVRNQTIGVDEVLVVDDGSSDDTAAVARSNGARVIQHEKNRGVSAARNTGVRAASNPWIAFLDADDLWKPHKTERQFRIVREHPETQVVFSDREHTRDGKVELPRFLPGHAPYCSVEKQPLGEDAYRLERTSLGRALFPGNFLKPSTLLLRSSLFEDIGGFDERFTAPDTLIGTCEDQDLALRLAVRTDPVVIESPLVIYRRREGTVSSNRIGLKLGYAYLAGKVLDEPERYPEGACDYFREKRPEVLREAAVMCMHEGAFDTAAGLLGRSLDDRIAPLTLVTRALCALGEPTFEILLRAKRKLGLPGLQ